MSRLFLFLAVFPLLGQSLSATERDERFRKSIEESFPNWVETRRTIHANPELSNEEDETAALVAERLRSLGLEVKTGVAKNGVIALLKGGREGACVAVRADMDALPITELNSKPFRSKVPGVMHACGHDVHTTVALGVAEILAKHRADVRGTVKFLFQPAEESLPTDFKGDWGAKLMVAEGALENPRPAAIFGLHCRPAIVADSGKVDDSRYLEAGQIAFTSGPDTANSDTFEVKVKGTMSHGSAPHRGVDAILVASEAISALQTIRSRRTDTRKPLVVTVGTIRGGQRHNIIADEVVFTGTVRTYDEAFRDSVIEMMEGILKGITTAHGASYELNYRKGYPSIFNNPDLVEATVPTFRRLFGEENVIEAIPAMGGEDFSFFAKVVPGFYFRLGVAKESAGITAELHTPAFDVDEECLKTGVAAMAGAVCDFLERTDP